MIVRSNPAADYVKADVYDAFCFSQVVRFNNLYFISGVAPVRGTMDSLELVGAGDIRAQTQHCLQALDSFLTAEGLDRSRVVSWTFYTTNTAALNALMPTVVADWCQGDRPACTILGVSGFAVEGQLVEITPIAARGS